MDGSTTLCCLRLGDKSDVRGYPSEEKFTPLYERCDRRVQDVNVNQGTKPKLRGNVTDDEKLIMGLKINNSPMDVLYDTKESSESVVLPSIGASEGDVRERESVSGAETKKPKRIRCAFCKKRLSIASIHTCRCGVVFCAPHRYAEVHGCRYDYKAEGQEYLRRANPLVSAPKLPKI